MKKWIRIVVICVLSLMLFACSGLTYVEELDEFDCSVLCAKESDEESYVITYSNTEIIAKSGVLTIQNQNDFDIVTYLLKDGEGVEKSEIVAGEVSVLYQLDKDAVYTLGCHADVDEDMEIKIMVYDGERADPF